MTVPPAPVEARRAEAWRLVGEVMDPEVPVLSVVELGIVRDVALDGEHVTVTITPTYSGCPAMRAIEHAILDALSMGGFPDAEVRTTFQPAWTTDWIPEEARAKLRAYGIAPPGPARTAAEDTMLVPLTRRRETVECPYCGSRNTELKSEFGSTACKSTLVCHDCRQPFEQFKGI